MEHMITTANTITISDGIITLGEITTVVLIAINCTGLAAVKPPSVIALKGALSFSGKFMLSLTVAGCQLFN